MPKKTKLQPVLISSREGMHAVVSHLVGSKLGLAAMQIAIEEEKAAIDRKYQEQIDELERDIQIHESGLQVWATQNPHEFSGKKSIDLPAAKFGFRTGPHKVEKAKGVKNWDEVVSRLACTVVQDGETVLFNGEDFIRYGAPAVDKDALLSAREVIPAEALKAAGVVFDQEEFFFFEPKSEVLEATKEVA